MVDVRTARRGGARGISLLVAAAITVAIAALVACGDATGNAGDGGVRVVVTFAPPTATPPPRSLTQPATLPTVSPVAFSTAAGTITNVANTQLMAGVKVKVRDSADGARLRESPSTTSRVVDTLGAGTALDVLSDPADAEGRTWVKVAFGNKQGFIATELVERTR